MMKVNQLGWKSNQMQRVKFKNKVEYVRFASTDGNIHHSTVQKITLTKAKAIHW